MRLVNSQTFTIAGQRGLFETMTQYSNEGALCSLALELMRQCYPVFIWFSCPDQSSPIWLSLWGNILLKLCHVACCNTVILLPNFHFSWNKEGKKVLLSHLSTACRFSSQKNWLKNSPKGWYHKTLQFCEWKHLNQPEDIKSLFIDNNGEWWFMSWTISYYLRW